MVTIQFEIEQNGYKLVDAIVLPDDHAFTDEEIEQIKLKRFYDWFETVTKIVEEEEEPVQELTEE